MDNSSSEKFNISIYGQSNSGKSTFFDALLAENNNPKSTTEIISKTTELKPLGKVTFTDTPGLNDIISPGFSNTEYLLDTLEYTDFAIYTLDINNFDEKIYKSLEKYFISNKIPFIVVFTKKDISDFNKMAKLSRKFENSYIISVRDERTIEAFKTRLVEKILESLAPKERLIEGLVNPNEILVLAFTDYEEDNFTKDNISNMYHKIIKDCLDNSVRCYISGSENLEKTILEKPKLVVTSTSFFKEAEKIITKDTFITTLPLLSSRQKGSVKDLYNGITAIELLNDNDKILIVEICSHNKSQEHLKNTIKIQEIMKTVSDKSLIFNYYSDRDFPKDIETYSLIVHCGGTISSAKEVAGRIGIARVLNIPITNYAMLLAYSTGILERAIEIFRLEEN